MFAAEWVQNVAGQELGYYSCVCGCVALGVALLPIMMSLVRSVETLPVSEWRVQKTANASREMTSSGYTRVIGEERDDGPEHSD
jgi:hypothetical protein